MRLRRAAFAAAFACLLPTLAACGGGGTTSSAGDVVPARQTKQFIHAKTSSVALPIGTLDVHAGKPVDDVPASDTHDLTALKAPAGMTYLPITWRYDDSTTKTYLQYTGTSALPTVDLRAGKGSYRLTTPDPAEGTESFYVLVDKSSSHPRLAVGFDGVTQQVDLTTGKRDAGRAKGLYALSHKRLRASKCTGTVDWSEIARASQTCRLTGPVLLPYAGGKWAKPGHEWLVMSMRTALTSYTQAGATPGSAGIYTAQAVKAAYRMGNHRPTALIPSNDASGTCPDQDTGTCNTDTALIFDVRDKAPRIKVVLKYRMVLAKGWAGYVGKKSETVSETARIRLHQPR
ncbi:MAG: hypothetical protein FWE71_06960 [Nocardioidaceae bacterium]|nr:hypothetical protein [Nocardioidaceae bacterium]MCL2613421.1 hypothetical protein [Nocardioidaceae bacterium]